MAKKYDKGNYTMTADEWSSAFTWINHPIAQLAQWKMFHPYGWQAAILNACWEYGARVPVRTCNGSGKSSYVIPILAASWCAAFPGSTVVITTASLAQGELQLWPVIQNLAASVGWQTSARKISAPKIDPIVPPAQIALRVTNSAENFEGFHEKAYVGTNDIVYPAPLLIIADEAKSIDPKIFTAIKRCQPSVILYVSTTGEDNGAFYDACMNNNGLWQTEGTWNGTTYPFIIPYTQCPHIMNTRIRQDAEADIAEKGRTDPDVCSMWLADFYRGGTHMVFNDSDMKAVRLAMSGLTAKRGKTRKAFCDFSGGRDELTFGLREGNFIHPIVAWTNDQGVAPEITAKKYIALFDHHHLKPSEVYGDNGGLGSQIINSIHNQNFPMVRVNANQKPRDTASYIDRYTELHWEFKQLLHDGNIILPEDAVLIEQMRLRRYVRKNYDENKIKTEPKQDARKNRGEHSPDRLETVVELCRNMETFSRNSPSRPDTTCGTPKDWWEQHKKDQEHKDEPESATFMDPW